VINYLKLNHFDVYQSQLNQHIILQRFLDLNHLLKDIDCDRIIWTDVKDVIFQTNPSHWLNKNKNKPIIACSECITFKDDEWAVTNAGTSFPMEWEWLQNKTSHCAGTIAGDKEYIRDLFINIYRWSLTSSNPDQLSDQAAYNVLINQTQYKDIVQFTPQEDGFATQLGTVLIKKDHFGDKLLEPTPIVDDLIRNQKGEPFVIVHQYDRNPQLKQSIHNMYKDKIYTEPSKDNALGFSYENWLSIRSKGKYDTQYNDLLKDKRVIIVGPSPSLVGSGKGKEIDDYDIVIRINKGFPIEEGMESDLGSRTDIHYHCLHTHPACGGKIFYEEMKDKLCENIPLRRLGTIDDQVGPIVFLCSELSNYLNGSVIDVNGGQL
ncbi:glycosyltransferase family 29 protein, partial [Glaciecola sp.]|nr:glycosyltransferase family 29 protein [Glaciecola sp.]